jgi:hypothetical protein
MHALAHQLGPVWLTHKSSSWIKNDDSCAHRHLNSVSNRNELRTIKHLQPPRHAGGWLLQAEESAKLSAGMAIAAGQMQASSLCSQTLYK